MNDRTIEPFAIETNNVMLDFFQRSVKQNSATGIPKSFDLIETVSELKGQPFKDEWTPTIDHHPQKTVSPPKPTITSINPTSGPVGGGTNIAIIGTGFIPEATVNYDGTLETSGTFTDPQHINSITPPHSAGLVDVEVENVSGLSFELVNGFEFLADPTISSVSDDFGDIAGGKAVSIFGANFVSGCTVSFDGVAASSVGFVNSGQVTCLTPAGGFGLADVRVQNPSGQIALQTGGFRYQIAPNILQGPPFLGPTFRWTVSPNPVHTGYNVFSLVCDVDTGYRGRLTMIATQSGCTFLSIPGYPGPVMMRDGMVSFQCGGFAPTVINPGFTIGMDDAQYDPSTNFAITLNIIVLP